MNKPMMKTFATTLALLLVASTASAQNNTEEPEPETSESECVSVKNVMTDAGLCFGTINPWVLVNLGFEITSCSGVKEKITADSVTVGGGIANGGPVWVAFFFANFKSEDKGWSWSFDCTLKLTEDVWAEGGDSLFREVAIYADSPSGRSKTEANCFYDGVMSNYCRTPTIMYEGDEFTISANSDGVTSGYPTSFSAESTAQGRNQPQGQQDECLHHHACYTGPTPWEIIDPRIPKHTPVISDSTKIEWKDASQVISDVHDGVVSPTPELL